MVSSGRHPVRGIDDETSPPTIPQPSNRCRRALSPATCRIGARLSKAACAPDPPNDVVGRLLGQCLSERLGQPFIIENRSGAGGTVGTEVVVRAALDGYTLLQVNTPNAINATLYDNLNYNFIRDIVPVASIIRTPLVMEVNPSFPTKTVPESRSEARRAFWH